MRKKFVFLSLLMLIMLFIITGCKRKVSTTSVLVPDKDSTTYYYTGEDIVYNIKANELYTISNNKQKNAGTYEVTVSLNDKTNCVWAKTGDTLDLKYEFIINPKKIDKPNVTVTEYGYTGEEITFDIPKSNFYTISNNKGTGAGEYQAKVSLNDKKNLVWSDDSTSDLTFNFSIVSNGISAATIEGINENYNYTGSEIMPNPIVKLANKTLTYNVDYALAYENNVNVGTAKLTITGINTYSGTKVINYNILKVDPTYNAPTAKANLVYTSQEQELINAGSCDEGTIEYKLGNGEYSTSIPKATNAGTYTVYYRIIGDANHNNIENKTLNVTISKTNPTITQPTIKSNLKYTGQPQQLINAGSTSGGTLVYSLDGTNWNESIPTATNVDEYRIYYKVIGNENYNDLDEKELFVSIAKGIPQITAPTAIENLVYDENLQTLINAGSTSGGTLEYKLENTDYLTTLPKAIGAGTYTVYYKVIGDANYEDVAEATITATIAKATPQITAPEENSIPYNGENQLLIYEIQSPGETTIQYKLNDGTYSTDLPQAKDLGTYTVYYKLIGDSNYNDLDEQSVTITIIKGTPIVNITAAEDLKYNATEQALITSATTTGGTLKYSLDGAPYTTDLPVALNAGTYTVWYKVDVDEDDNYNALEPQSIEVEISKAAPVVTAPTAKADLVYNKNSQILINNDATTTGGTLKYSLDNITYSTDLPSAINAGIYTVYYKVDGNDNYEDFDYSILNVEIAKATPTYTAPVPNDLTYSGENQTLVSAGTTTGGTLKYSLDNNNYSTDLPQGNNAVEYKVWYKVDGNDNYNGIAPQFITVEIKKATPTYEAPTAKTALIYNTEAQDLINAGSTEHGTFEYKLNDGEYTTSIPKGTSAGPYTVYYILIGDANHKDVEQTINVTIGKATPQVTAPTPRNLRRTGESQVLIVAGSTTGGTLVYSLTNTDDYSTSLPTAIEAGDYKVWFKVIGNENYNDTTPSYVDVKITVEKQTPTVTAPVAIDDLVYTGEPLTIATDATTTGGTLAYKLNNGIYGYTLPKAINAGTYRVWYKVIGNDDYLDVEEAYIDVTIAKAPVNYTAPTANSRDYTGTPIYLVTGAATSHGTFNYKLGDGEYSTSIPQATNVGKYTVWYKIIGDNNHNDVDEVSIVVEISKATPEVNAPTAKSNLTYNKNSQTLINAGSTTGGTLLYSLNNINYSADLPSATNAGTYTVYYKVEGNDNYEGVDADSIPVTISKATPIITAPTAKTLTYNRESQVLINAGSTTGGTLLYSLDNIDYSADLPSETNAGTYTVYYKVEGNDNYEGVDADSISVTISPRSINISSVNVTLSQTSYTYNGSAFEPTVTSVTEGTFTFDSDLYEVTYSNNIHAGQGQVIITADDANYTGSKIVYFEILAKPITDAVITLEHDEYAYTGYSIEPVVSKVMLGTIELVKDVDYTVSYVTAMNVGTYNVTINGAGNYRLTTTKSFTIVSKNVGISRATLTLGDSNFIYNGNSQIPTITIVDEHDSNYELVLDKDYMLTFVNTQGGEGNTTNAGTITVTATGIGNIYTGTISDTYTISKKEITSPTIVIAEATYTGSLITPTIVSVHDGTTNITALCTVTSGSAKRNAGTYDIQITFSSNSDNVEGGPFDAQFTIKPKAATELTIENINDVPYTQDVITNGAKPALTIKDGTQTLSLDTDFEVSYSNNHGEDITATVDTSVATITITYKGNYTGSATKTFNIVNREYTITYVNDETETTSKYHSIDDEVVLASPTKTGYNGYWNSTNGQFQFGATTTPATLNGDITLTAVWTAINYTITYTLNDPKATNSDNNPTSYTITSNTITLEPATYANSNATFGGWYDNDKLNGEAITEITQGSHEYIHLYAKWNYVSFNITYELNGGTNDPLNPASAIPTDTITLLNPTRDYYDFEGWHTESTFTDANKITQISNLTDHKTIYANWTVHNYTITYNYDNNITSGSLIGSNSNPTLYNVENDPIVLSDVQAGGYRFDGWFDSSDNKVTTIDTSHPSDITITGKFTKHNITFEKYLNDVSINNNTPGQINDSISSNPIVENATATATVTVKAGYTFDGWYKVVDNTDVKITEGLSADGKTLTFNLTVDTTVYKAKYYSYSLSYTSENLNKGSVSLNVTSNMKANGTNNYLVPVGETATLTASTNAGYTFIGWFKNDETIATSTSLEYTYTMTAANVSFEARWIQVTVGLEQYDNIATVTQLDSTYRVGENVTIVASTSVNEAIFLGWFKDSSTTPISINLSFEFTMPDVNTTYTAKFVENLVTVQDRLLEYSFDSNNNVYLFQYSQNDNINSSYEIAVSGNQLTYTMSANAKFVFAGWYTDESSKTLLSDEFAYTFTAPSEATLITALWVKPLSMAKNPDDEALTYTSSFDLVKNGISFTAQDNVSYTWNGWYNSNDTLNTGNKTLTLSYENSYKKLIDESDEFNGLPTYTAKWTLAGIVVQSADISRGTVEINRTTNPYTIKAIPVAGYQFVRWTKDGVDYSGDAETTVTSNDETATYVAHFETRSNIEYHVNIRLQDYNNPNDYTTLHSSSYTGNNGSTNGYVFISFPDTTPTGYSFKEAKIGNDVVTTISSGENLGKYQLDIANDGSAAIDFYFDLLTVNVTYHHNDGTTPNATATTVKYDTTSGHYTLKSYNDATWYTNQYLTDTNPDDEADGSITYVDSNAEVWACYDGNYNLADKFDLTNNLINDTYWKIVYKGTVADATIVIPDYINDKPSKKVNVDNLYSATPQYTSLTMPSTLEFIEYGKYPNSSNPISWIILLNENSEYKLLSETSLTNCVFNTTESFDSYDETTIKQLTDSIVTVYNDDTKGLLDENDYNNYQNIIVKHLTSSWWINNFLYDDIFGLFVSYVDANGNLISCENSGSTYNAELGLRPTITITL